MKFENMKLDQLIIDALYTLGYKQPLTVQEKVIPIILKQQDVLVKSKTGSGKTACFAIPAIQLIDWNEKAPQCLVLTPTRELALQIKEEFDLIGAYKRIKTVAVFGKQPYRFQIQDLKQRCHVVVGTPGRILDHLQQGTLQLSNLRFVILDEADEMLNMGFIENVKQIMQYFPGNLTTCLFSATLPEEIKQLAATFLHNEQLIELPTKNEVSEQVEHYAYEVKEQDKLTFLIKLLCVLQPVSCIIFAKTQEHVIQICDALYEKKLCVDKLHGGMLQEDRIQNLKDFKKGKLRLLVATDVASRGIDIQKVTHIINYDMPVQKEIYVHRIGRSGRVEQTGIAISFISQYDELRVKELEEFIHMKLPIKDNTAINEVIVKDQILEPLRQIINIKEDKGTSIRKDTMKLYINGGKNKKIRAGDIVGAICEIDGVSADDIGIIQVQERQSYVDILHAKGEHVLAVLKHSTIKGKVLRVAKAKNEL